MVSKEKRRRTEKVAGRFKRYLSARGMSLTRPRLLILEEIVSSGGHFEADDIYLSLKRRKKGVSKATVYRSLPLLKDCGIIREVIFGESHSHYENILDSPHHDHLICVECGSVMEFSNRRIEALQKEVCESHGFRPTGHTLEITGLCRNCSPEGGGT